LPPGEQDSCRGGIPFFGQGLLERLGGQRRFDAHALLREVDFHVSSGVDCFTVCVTVLTQWPQVMVGSVSSIMAGSLSGHLDGSGGKVTQYRAPRPTAARALTLP
jgi:hypothetical protein